MLIKPNLSKSQADERNRSPNVADGSVCAAALRRLFMLVCVSGDADGTILSVEHMTVVRGGRRIHQDVNLRFGAGITAVLGPNGVGKTTLIEGILQPGRGAATRVRLDGVEVGDSRSTRDFFARTGHMPQDWAFMGSLTARESVEYVAWLKGIGSRSIRAAAERALDWVDLSDHACTKVRSLSGGMRQRVGLAEAFVNDPRVILLDEPTVGLDPAQRAAFRRFVKNRASDRAIIISTHLTDDVEAIADRVLVLSHLGVVFDGTPNVLAARGAHAVDAVTRIEAGYLEVVDAPLPSPDVKH